MKWATVAQTNVQWRSDGYIHIIMNLKYCTVVPKMMCIDRAREVSMDQRKNNPVKMECSFYLCEDCK